MYVEWGYTDGSTGSVVLFSGQLAGWNQINLLPSMTSGKTLNRIQLWGYSGGGGYADITRLDDFLFCY
jgi:hypothetical protein